LGLDAGWTGGGLRLTVGQQNDERDVDKVIAMLPGIVTRLREFSSQFA
jgi:cysteine sulfinate desulfinase/cysteine desulfurase-like protein